MKEFFKENQKLITRICLLLLLGLVGAYTPIDKSLIFIGVLFVVLS